MHETPPPAATNDPRLTIMADSFRRFTGRSLIAVDDKAGVTHLHEQLWHAPAVIVAHGTEADPVFFYGNRQALRVFDMDFVAFTRLPSRLSAEQLLREERERLLQRVSRDGFIDDYAGVRISATGNRFRIEKAVVWNLLDAAGTYHGQAATFSQWQPLPQS
jgi:hypothetical protein